MYSSDILFTEEILWKAQDNEVIVNDLDQGFSNFSEYVLLREMLLKCRF